MSPFFKATAIGIGLLVVSFAPVGVVSLPDAAATIYGNGYFPNSIRDQIYVSSLTPNDISAAVAGSTCSTPYGELRYFSGLNKPKVTHIRKKLAMVPSIPPTFVPSQQVDVFTTSYGCSGNIYTPHPATMCLCSPNGSCYQMNETGSTTTLYFYAWCNNTSGECTTYLGLCDPNTSGVFWDLTTGEVATNCTAINAGGPLGDCFPGSTNCSYLPVAYVNCGPCLNATLELDCAGPIERGAPPIIVAVPLVLPQPAPGENFHNITGLIIDGTCNNCNNSSNTTQYIYSGSIGQFACLNGTDSTQVDWTGLCMCDVLGGCYRFRALSDGSATINSVIKVAAGTEPVGFVVILECRTIDPGVILENLHGGAVFTCDGEYSNFVLPIASLRCSGGCPTEQPLQIYCSGPYVRG